jgi:sugar phosphate isomerase/epimerase
MWPGLVGKGGPDAEPAIALDTMLDLTAAADVDGVRFDGVDLFLFDPHTSIDATEDDLKSLADKLQSHDLVAGSLVAPVWPPTGGGSAMGGEEDRKNFLTQVRKACEIGKVLNRLGARKYGVIRIESASGVSDWVQDSAGNQKTIADTFRQACDIAEGYGERLAAEGEICWGGMQSWKKNVELMEMGNRPKTLGFQADMAHTLLFTMGYNAPEDRILPEGYDWKDRAVLDRALVEMTRWPWTIDFHGAERRDREGIGLARQTGRHCPPRDPNGKLDFRTPPATGCAMNQAG